MNMFAEIVLSYLDSSKCSHEQLFNRNVFLTCKDMAAKIKRFNIVDCNAKCNVICKSCKLYGRNGCKNCICLKCMCENNEQHYRTITHMNKFHPKKVPLEPYIPYGCWGIQSSLLDLCYLDDKERKKKRYSKLCHNFPKTNQKALKYNR